MSKRMLRPLVILIAAGVGLYFFVFRKSDLATAAIVPNPAMPPAETKVKSGVKKKTVFGKIVSGATEVSRIIPGQTGQTLARYGDILGGITK